MLAKVRSLRLLACVLAVAGWSSAAMALPIVYTFAGTGTGSIGGQAFTNAAFSINVTSDTSNVTLETVPGSGNTIWIVPGTSAVTIAGIGTANITIQTRVINNGAVVGWARATGGNFDILDIFATGLTNYALNTNFGPVPGTSPFLGFGAGPVTSNQGDFVLTSASSITFRAVVPAPGAAGVLAMSGLLVARRRRVARHD